MVQTAAKAAKDCYIFCTVVQGGQEGQFEIGFIFFGGYNPHFHPGTVG